MIVFARKEGTYIWSDNNGTHKAGKVPLHEPLFTDGERPSGWYLLTARPRNLSLPENPSYPDYWVKVGDTVNEVSVPDPDPGDNDPGLVIGEVSDNDLAIAIVVFLKWLKQ